MSDFDVVGPEAEEHLDAIGPPGAIAVASCAVAACSIVISIMSGTADAVQWLGWGLGYSAVLLAIAFRWASRSRQMTVFYIPDYRIDRLALIGALLGFVGIALNAWDLAQQAVWT